MQNLKTVQENILAICTKELHSSEQKKLFGIACSKVLSVTDVHENFSRKEIEDYLREILVKAREVQEERRKKVIEREVSKLEKFLKDQIKKWIIIVPLENLILDRKIMRIGNVTFYKFSDNRKRKMIRMLRAILRPNPHYSWDEKKKLVQLSVGHELDPILNKVCGEVKIKGRLEVAYAKALQIVKDATLVIKLYRNIQDDAFGRYFDLMGDLAKGRRVVLRFPEDKIGYNPILERVGTLFPYKIDHKKRDFMTKWGLSEIGKMLAKTKLTDLEQGLLSSILWCGRACEVQLRKEEELKDIFPHEKTMKTSHRVPEMFNVYDRLIKLMIALESMLIFDENEPIQNNIAERCALFLGKSYSKRKRIKEFIKDMYGLRSNLVHHGHADVSKRELDRLTVLTQSLILNVLKRRKKLLINTKKDFKEWFEKKKLTY